jgi:carbamate kinase
VLIVVAIGGNARLRRDEPADISVQRAHLKVAAEGVAQVVRRNRVVLTHGNGPQIGLLALESETRAGLPGAPLDGLSAESEGMVGYLIEQELGGRLPHHRLATLLTQVVVDAADIAFSQPTKPVGPVYSEARARRLAVERGWVVGRESGGWRRVVASPEPLRIIEVEAIRTLVEHDVVVTCAGGGGIPVVDDGKGPLRGVEAVIDKDLAAALLARELRADALVLLTDVDGVYEGWGGPAAVRLGEVTPRELRRLRLPAGTMGPKAEAACRFVESGGRYAAIGTLEAAAAVAAGGAGTVVRAAASAVTARS